MNRRGIRIELGIKSYDNKFLHKTNKFLSEGSSELKIKAFSEFHPTEHCLDVRGHCRRSTYAVFLPQPQTTCAIQKNIRKSEVDIARDWGIQDGIDPACLTSSSKAEPQAEATKAEGWTGRQI